MSAEICKTTFSRRYHTLITALALTGVAAIIPLLVSGYQRTLIQKGLLWIPAVFGVYILYSLLRQVHFGQSIFIGIGSYITAFLAGKYEVTTELSIILPAALVASTVIAYVLGIFITKRTGFYFAVMGIAVTMVFGLSFIKPEPLRVEVTEFHTLSIRACSPSNLATLGCTTSACSLPWPWSCSCCEFSAHPFPFSSGR